jgi:hypothetical protein
MQIAPTSGVSGTGVSEAKLTPSTGQTGPVAVGAATSAATSAQPPNLADTAVIRELAVADLLKLTQILQPTASPERIVRVENLIEETISAIREDRLEWAVGRFIEAVTAVPTRADELRSDPEIAPIRNTVEQLIARLSNVAKMDAETKLASAEQLLENSGWPKLPHWETAPEALIQIGHGLLEAGGYANYVRTAELATTLQSAYWSATVIEAPLSTALPAALKKEDTSVGRKSAGAAALGFAHHTWLTLREKLPRQVEALWVRVPLLVLLATWFTFGLVGGMFSILVKTIWPGSGIVSASDFGFQVWGLGLLALVGFGFWTRIRKPR